MIENDMFLWGSAPEKMSLPKDEVHVWRASLDLRQSQVSDLQKILNRDEMDRAGRFRFPEDGKRFIITRGLLRTILGFYLDVSPEELRFFQNFWGKPGLIPEGDGEALTFNVSHSSRLGLFAVCRGREIGIDLERIRADLSWREVARHFFSKKENAILESLPGILRRKTFFKIWICREAYLKARGEGLESLILQTDFSLASSRQEFCLTAPDDYQGISNWLFREFTPAPGYVAAVAARGCDWRLVCWQFPENGEGDSDTGMGVSAGKSGANQKEGFQFRS